MTRRPILLAVLGVTFTCVALAEPQTPDDDPFVCLAEVPTWAPGEEGPVFAAPSLVAAQTLARFLAAEQVFVFHPTEEGTPLETMASVVDLNPAALLVGVRSLHNDPQCVAVHAPATPRWRDATPIGDSPIALREATRRADATERATLSQRVAARVASAVPVCPRAPDEWVEYFVSASRGPTIVVELRPGSASSTDQNEEQIGNGLLEAVAGAIVRYLAEPPHNKWMHQTKRFD